MNRLVEIRDINELQQHIMRVIDDWVHEKKVPIPHKKILAKMGEVGVKTYTTINALNALIKKGYIRRGCIVSNTTTYVQLRRI